MLSANTQLMIPVPVAEVTNDQVSSPTTLGTLMAVSRLVASLVPVAKAAGEM